MRSVTYSMGVSLDGYTVDPDGRIDWTAPDDELFRFAIDQIRAVDVHLMGRRLYDAMLYWEDADPEVLSEAEREWTVLWKALPKVVFSSTLSAVRGSNTRLAEAGLADEIERLRAEPADGEIALGGSTLAAEASILGLIDEYRPKMYPVFVGGGIPYFPQRQAKLNLDLIETRSFPSGVVYLRYRTVRQHL